MKFCTNCGSQLAEGAKFCTECGAKIFLPEAAAVQPPVHAAEHPPVVAPAPIPPVPAAVPETPPAPPAPPPEAGPFPPTPVPDGATAKKRKKPIPLPWILLVLVVIAAAAACIFLFGGKKALKPYAGKYEAAYVTYGDLTETAENQWLQLNGNGSGTICVLGSEYSIRWELSGNNICVEQNDVVYKGNLKDGIITLDLSGREYVFHASSVPAPTLPKPMETTVPTETTPQETTVPPTTEPVTAFYPCTYSGGRYSITVVAAEAFKDYEGRDGIRVYYDYTNLSDDKSMAFYTFNVIAAQDGEEAQYTYVSMENDVPEYGNDMLYVWPGHTVRCIAEFLVNPDGGLFAVAFEDLDSYETLMTLEFDPTVLPGRSDEPVPNAPDPDAAWRDDYDDAGSFDDLLYFSIDDAEITVGPDGEEMIRVYMTATNTNDSRLEFWRFGTFRAYQDGIQLPSYDASEITDTDWAYKDLDAPETFIQPGETVVMSVCFPIHSMNPVLVEFINDYDNRDGFAAVYLLS